MASDAAAIAFAAFAAFTIRFEGLSWIGTSEGRVAREFLLVALPLKLALFWAFGLYRRLWRYASIADLEQILLATLIAGIASSAVGALLLPMIDADALRVPLSVLFVDGFITALGAAGPRLFARALLRGTRLRRRVGARRVLVVGAGAAGGMIVRELLENRHLGLAPVGLVDDDRVKHGHRLHGVRVLGPLSEINQLINAHSVDEVVIAIPTAPGRVVREVVRAAHEAGVSTRTVPGMSELILGRKSVSALRQVAIEDLLRRDPITTDVELVRTLATGETVLVTGAGGSIGSELCRQIARLDPATIVALGRGENSIFELVQELTRAFPTVRIEPVIADVRDRDRLHGVFERWRPCTVFHAAAHKHVPLMEANVGEAVINNVLGTRNVAELSAEFEVEHFVLISSDKAVRPTSVMGATKRIAEAVVQDLAERTGLNFVSVRFGNVLGSRGSVVPTFLRQIAAGGPVTITDPEMRRYFMTIPEAVQLVLQAGALGRGSEVFVLDMGEPVKIVDLASDLIRLSGLEVGTDVEIHFTGARPGEKLYEELFFSAENAAPTVHPKVLRAKNIELSSDLAHLVNATIAAALANEPNDVVRAHIKRLVPEYIWTEPARMPGEARPLSASSRRVAV